MPKAEESSHEVSHTYRESDASAEATINMRRGRTITQHDGYKALGFPVLCRGIVRRDDARGR